MESKRMSQISRLISIVVLGLLGLAVQATAETYPERVVRIVNPYPPGGSVDVMARILAQKLADNFGQQVIVENRSGGGGNTGSDFVAKAEPDGYTLLFTAPGPLTVNQTLYSKLPFDPAKDFAPVALFATAPIVPIVNPNVPANGVQELIALAKKEPGKLNFASAGNGTTNHLSVNSREWQRWWRRRATSPCRCGCARPAPRLSSLVVRRRAWRTRRAGRGRRGRRRSRGSSA